METSRIGLIGYTGFVGSNLLRQTTWSHVYNSQNIELIEGENFETLVCAGVSAVKWWANKNPSEDWFGIERLLRCLAKVEAKRVVLISTIDVYPDPLRVNEDSPLSGLTNHPYGTHRLRVEEFFRKNFPSTHIIRLAGLFGNGLKKNIIYDMLHHNNLEAIHPLSRFQWYPIDNLWEDILRICENNISLVNLVAEPVLTKTIQESFFSDVCIGSTAATPTHYDIHTKHAHIWRRPDGYQYSAEASLAALGEFVNNYRSLAA